MYLDPTNNIGICVLTNGEGDAYNICDELYQYGLNLSSNSGITPNCANPVGITAIENKEEIDIYPNPVKDFVTIKISQLKSTAYHIYSMVGELVLSGNLEENNKINLSHLPSSIYLLKMENQTIKLIKTE